MASLFILTCSALHHLLHCLLLVLWNNLNYHVYFVIVLWPSEESNPAEMFCRHLSKPPEPMVIIIWEPWLLHSLGARGHKCTSCHLKERPNFCGTDGIRTHIMFKVPHKMRFPTRISLLFGASAKLQYHVSDCWLTPRPTSFYRALSVLSYCPIEQKTGLEPATCALARHRANQLRHSCIKSKHSKG